MKATSIQTSEGLAPWSAETVQRHANAGIVKVLYSPGSIGSTTFLVIDADGYLVKGTAANYHNIEGIIPILYQCQSIYDAAHEMRKRHYRSIVFLNPETETAA